MPYPTNWIQTIPFATSPGAFLRSSFRHYVRSFRPYHFASSRRTPDGVRKSYNSSRQLELERLETIDWDSFVYFPEEWSDFVLIDDKVTWGRLRRARTQLLARLEEVAAEYARPGATIIEFGSGDGRNLLHLKKLFPNTRFIGLELSDVSVQLSREAAKKFGLNVEFFEANVCEELPKLPRSDDVTLAYSSFALEMMPRIFTRAVDKMADSTSGGLVFFEPAGELWPLNLRGISSRLRVLQLDRLRGLSRKVRELTASANWELLRMERLKVGINPLNEACEIHLRRRGLPRGHNSKPQLR
jgi:hypothetical protein